MIRLSMFLSALLFSWTAFAVQDSTALHDRGTQRLIGRLSVSDRIDTGRTASYFAAQDYSFSGGAIVNVLRFDTDSPSLDYFGVYTPDSHRMANRECRIRITGIDQSAAYFTTLDQYIKTNKNTIGDGYSLSQGNAGWDAQFYKTGHCISFSKSEIATATGISVEQISKEEVDWRFYKDGFLGKCGYRYRNAIAYDFASSELKFCKYANAQYAWEVIDFASARNAYSDAIQTAHQSQITSLAARIEALEAAAAGSGSGSGDSGTGSGSGDGGTDGGTANGA